MIKHVIDRLKIFSNRKEYLALHDLLRFYTYLLVVWGFYRVLFRFPGWVEELILKPIVFLLPVLTLVAHEKKNITNPFAGKLKVNWASLGIRWKNLFAALAYGLSLGVFYLFVGRMGQFFRFGGVVSNPYGSQLINPVLVLVLALATSVSEEVVFMGYLLPRFQKIWKDEWRSATVIAVLFAVLHLPVLIFSYRFPISLVLGQFLLTFILGFGNSVLMLRLKNVAAPIMSHWLWGMAVLLFR